MGIDAFSLLKILARLIKLILGKLIPFMFKIMSCSQVLQIITENVLMIFELFKIRGYN